MFWALNAKEALATPGLGMGWVVGNGMGGEPLNRVHNQPRGERRRAARPGRGAGAPRAAGCSVGADAWPPRFGFVVENATFEPRLAGFSALYFEAGAG